MGFNITRGVVPSPVRCVITGVEGIGKSTFASRFPEPLFIDTEGSTKQLNVMRFDPPTSWQMLMEEVDAVIRDPSLCQTLVIDTIDWAEKMCAAHVIAANNWKSLETPGYGSGYRYVYEEFGKLLDKLTLLPPKGVNVVLIAHTALRRVEQPDEFGTYDKWELKLQNSQKCSNAAMVKEWADMVLFCNYKTIVVKENDNKEKGKARGGRRVMYTTHAPCWDAKNRFGLPEECDLSYDVIAPFVPSRAVVVNSQPVDVPGAEVRLTPAPVNSGADVGSTVPVSGTGPFMQLVDLMQANQITEDEVLKAMANMGVIMGENLSSFPDDLIAMMATKGWNQILNEVAKIRSQSTEMPF